jgi:acetyl-CoA carboxylase biotin carboxyl carrier protein
MAKLGPEETLIRKLASLLDEFGLNEIEYEADGRRVRVSRGGPYDLPVAAAPGAPTPTPETEAPATPPAPGDVITSPMVGTVYVAPEPGAPAFVKAGDTVTEGQTLFVIEAMKVMNPLPSPRAGKVLEILVRDTQPVEFGEPLIVLE